MKPSEYFAQGLAIPSYDISKNEFTFAFEGMRYRLGQGKSGFDYWNLEYGPDGFKVMPIEKLDELVQAQNAKPVKL